MTAGEGWLVGGADISEVIGGRSSGGWRILGFRVAGVGGGSIATGSRGGVGGSDGGPAAEGEAMRKHCRPVKIGTPMVGGRCRGRGEGDNSEQG